MSDYEILIRPKRKLHLGLKELWLYRELFYFFTWRDIKVKYKQTLLGVLWAILQPLAMMLVFVLFFSRLLSLPTDEIPAPIFYFSGLLFWNLFSSGLSGAANSMIDNANIIKKVYFPRLIIPISSVLVALFDFAMAFCIFLGLLGFYYFYNASWQPDFYLLLLYLPLSLLLVLLTTFGAGSLLAALNVKYRDFRYIIPFMIQFLLFVSPVIYPVSVLSKYPLLQKLSSLNPLVGALSLSRAGFLQTNPDWTLILISFVSAFGLFLFGLLVFRKTEAYFADLA